MSSSSAAYLTYVSEQTTIYLGCFVLITGILGGILTTIVLLSLKTFRETSCAFYLTVASIVALCQLLTTVMSRIIISGFGIDISVLSLFYCRFRSYLSQAFSLIFLTCMCLCIIDQFLSITNRWRYVCTLSFAHRSVLITIIVCFIHGIPYIFFFEIARLSSGHLTCTYLNPAFRIYFLRFYLPVLTGLLPITIMIIFGLLAFRNIRTLASRQVNFVRLGRDRQLTAMALSQVLVQLITSVPYIIVNIYSQNTTTSDPVLAARNQLLVSVTLMISYLQFGVSCSC
jgi:hypothetical protein